MTKDKKPVTKILIVEDQAIIARDIEDYLRGAGFDATAVVSSGKEAIKKAEQTKPDLVLMDIVLKGDMSGIEAGEKITEKFDIPIIYLTAHSDKSTLDRAKVTQPYGYITKPFKPEALKSNIEMALYKHTMETKLKHSEQRFRALYEDNPSMYFTVDPDGAILSVNKFGAQQLGYKPEELIGKSCLTLIHPENRKEFIKALRECAKNLEQFFQWEFRKIRKGTSLFWSADCARAVKDASGNTVVLIVCKDVTEAKEASIALRRAHDALELRVQERTRELSEINMALQVEIEERKRTEEKLHSALSDVKSLKNQLENEKIYLQEEIDLQHRHGEILGDSRAIRDVLIQIEQVAESDATVLLLGETGTGKELLAHAIHNLSKRSDRVMVKMNCAALPANLIESELFGYEKGAFSGAEKRKIGRFEVAAGSTVFLDEIGDLPLELQPKLLRVLEEGTFYRLGSSKDIKVDVRIIAATNTALDQAVKEGFFREDLYYRLSVFPIRIPPLRERKEDIPPLVRAFIKEIGDKMGKRIEEIPTVTMKSLQSYDWPGNVRELRNIVEQAMILNNGPKFRLHMPSITVSQTAQSMRLDELERRHILDILETNGWRIRGRGGAAEVLGLKPTTLESKMKKLGIQRTRDHA